MDFFKKHKCVTSHHTSLLLRIVSAPRCCVGQHWRVLCLVCAAAFALNSLLSICNQNDFFNKSFLFVKMPTVKHCAIALSLLITSPLALTLQQNFLRQIATNTDLPSPSQKPYHIFTITPHLAHPSCKKRLAIGPAKIKLTRTTPPISHLRHAERTISLIQSYTT